MGLIFGSQKYHMCSESHVGAKYDSRSLTPSNSLWFRCDRNLKTKNKTITKILMWTSDQNTTRRLESTSPKSDVGIQMPGAERTLLGNPREVQVQVVKAILTSKDR